MLSNISVGQFWTIELFVLTSIGVSKRVGNGVAEGVVARLCFLRLKHFLLHIWESFFCHVSDNSSHVCLWVRNF